MTLVTSKSVNEQILKALEGHTDALEFLGLFGSLGDLLDDEVDEVKDAERVKQLAIVFSQMYNCKYWKQWGHLLSIVEHLVINQYFDSVKWESADEQWKREHAKVYSHAGINMIFAVILIDLGHAKLSEISLLVREAAYNIHKEDKV